MSRRPREGTAGRRDILRMAGIGGGRPATRNQKIPVQRPVETNPLELHRMDVLPSVDCRQHATQQDRQDAAPFTQQAAGHHVNVLRMIRDIERLRTAGRVRRLVAELGVPVRQWRDALQAAARNRGWRVQTLLVVTIDPGSGQPVQEVRAVRTDGRAGRSRGRPGDAGHGAPQPASVRPMPSARASDVATERARRAGHPCTWD
jgi:hypothetical protein